MKTTVKETKINNLNILQSLQNSIFWRKDSIYSHSYSKVSCQSKPKQVIYIRDQCFPRYCALTGNIGNYCQDLFVNNRKNIRTGEGERHGRKRTDIFVKFSEKP